VCSGCASVRMRDRCVKDPRFTLKRRCTYRPSVIYLIVNKLLSLSLSLSSLTACDADSYRSLVYPRDDELLPHSLTSLSHDTTPQLHTSTRGSCACRLSLSLSLSLSSPPHPLNSTRSKGQGVSFLTNTLSHAHTLSDLSLSPPPQSIS